MIGRGGKRRERGDAMFEGFTPKIKIGCLQPNAVIDNAPFEFYRLAPPGVMLVMVGVGLKEFSSQDVERVFAPLDTYLDQLMERGVDLVVQNGVPLPILIGIEAHDRMVAHMARYTGLPATTTAASVMQTAADLGIKKVAVVNKWTDAMNRSLAAFFARAGTAVVGGATKSLHPTDFHRIDANDHMQLAYELGRRAFLDHPDTDAVYIGGGSWIAEPVAVKLEEEFGKPVLCNQAAVIRNTLKMLGAWKPMSGHSRVLATA
ncbi:MAG: maleate isomerase [Alphaproteobacteria bacterium]|jgi:maleate isomerase|nr:maleate isomerase [Alphaproteobacteria bacterium]